MASISRAIRRLRRKRIGVAISFLILSVAALVLGHALHDLDFGKVAAALEAQSGGKILSAATFVVAGYMALCLYDVFALRTIGRRDVPFQIAALASFTSYTIGHTLGAATLTAGFIRLRVYSVWGLNVIDVAKIAVITGMTFCLGITLLLGGAVAYAPQAASVVDTLPWWLNRLIGLSALSGIACYLMWLMPQRRAVGRSAWRVVLPDLRWSLVQIAIGSADLGLVTLAMYCLLPASSMAAFPTVMVVFLTATLLGVMSHAPGGLGVIEAAMLVGLPQLPREELLAALLTFRVLYYLIPLCLAASILGLCELRQLGQPTTALPRRRCPVD